MRKVTLGSTNITVNFNGFGVLPIQRVPMQEAKTILRKAYDNGVDFYDTARGYTDSEEKIGYALSDVRDKIILATKTPSTTPEGIRADIATSLAMLKTDYVDIYQLHNPAFCPKLNDGTGVYETMLELKAEGKIRHIGITNHRMHVAIEAANSGLYETIQFPFCYLADEKEIELVKLCREKNIGFICMKALSGGLITDSATAYAYLAQYDNVLPIWGIQRESELDEFLSYHDNEPAMDDARVAYIEKERLELCGDFCRGCGYCLPCPADINIPIAARMALLLRRAPTKKHLSDEGRESMNKINDCINCGNCVAHCPYGLDTPDLLRRNLVDYMNFIGEKNA